MLPSAKATQHPDERRKLRRVIEERGLVGLANDTKWDELLAFMRSRREWLPSYRYKCVDGPPSGWDVEWYYHLPFPLMSVEWFDIGRRQETYRGRLIPPLVTDHLPWIEAALRQIGFDYEVGPELIRIFGYAPRSMELFDE